MEAWKKFKEDLNEQEANKPPAPVDQKPKQSSAKRFESENQLPSDPSARETMLMQATPEGKDYLVNKIPFSLNFDIDDMNGRQGPNVYLITVQSKLDTSLIYIYTYKGSDPGSYQIKQFVMKEFFKSSSAALELHSKMENEKYGTFKKAYGHYWLAKQKQAKASTEKIKQDTKKAAAAAVKKTVAKVKPEKIKNTPEVVKAKKAAIQKKPAPVQKKVASPGAPGASNDVVKKVQSGKWTKGGKSFPKANPEVINLIYKLQGLIGTEQDGVFGNETAKAIRKKYYGK